MATPSELVDRLFIRLSAMYGARFLDMWRDVRLDEVKRCWAQDLAPYSVEMIGHAVTSLKTRVHPPTLPEFVSLCEAARQVIKPVGAYALALPAPKVDKTDPSFIDAHQRIMAASRELGRHTPSREWAEQALKKHRSREQILTEEALRFVIRALPNAGAEEAPDQQQKAA